MLANRYVPMYPAAGYPLGRPQCPNGLEEQHGSPNGQAEETHALSDFMLKYAQILPLRISVVKGYYGGDERHAIATGDVYNVHFVKHSKVALLKDSSGIVYTIPLNSTVQFGPIFNLTGDMKVALQGFHFERVSDIMAQVSLPKVVHATESHVRSDPKSSVEQHEILVVQKIVQTPMRKKALQVYSITKREQKILESDCLGGFTTDPYSNRLHLPEIIEHFSDIFPLEVQVVMEEDIPENMPYDVTSEVSSLTGVQTESSLIASTSLEENEDNRQKTIEIPVDLPIDVRVIQPVEETELERLYACTRKLYEKFDPFSTLSVKISSSTLRTGVRRGFEREGLELQRPDSLYDRLACRSPAVPRCASASAPHKKSGPGTRLPPPPKPTPYSKHQHSPQATMGNAPAKAANRRAHHEYQALCKQTQAQQQQSRSYATCTPRHSVSRRKGSFMITQSSEKSLMTAPVTLLEFEKLEARVEMLEREVYALRSEIAVLRSQGGPTSVLSTQQVLEKENVQHLKTFSVKKVSELLQVMSMSQYSEKFISEQITGEILTECDEKILAKELGVSSKIHCKKLLLVISGKISAAALLAKQSPS